MKTKFKFLLLLPVFALLMLTSCQEETVDITPPDEAEALIADSQLTNFISATSKRDGSKDNIIDTTSCISVKLPVTVKVRSLEITVNAEEDYELIEKIYDQFDDDVDVLDIIFPITIINANHEEFVINNAEELSKFIKECTNEVDDDIECVDFKYPISFSVFNVDFEMIETVSIESDRQLHKFIQRIKNKEVIASIDFPVTMNLADGTSVQVNNNAELQRTIEDAKDACDEDDDNDHNDDDFTKERLEEYLKECPWLVYEFKRDNQVHTDQYAEYAINFKEDGVVGLKSTSGDVLTGAWSTRITDRGALLKMEFETLVDFTLEWFVYNFEDGKIKLFQGDGNRIVLKRNCDVVVDVSKERVETLLKQCLWRVARLNVDGADNEKEYIGTPLKFFENNKVKIRVNGELVEGTYEVIVRNEGIGLEINLDGRPDLKLQWTISFLGEEVIKLTSETNEMVLERHCPNTDEDVDSISNILINGEWEVSSYFNGATNATQEYFMYTMDFIETGRVKVTDPNNGTFNGSWLSYRKEGLKLGLFFGNNAPFDDLNLRWKIQEVSPNRIQLKDPNTNGNTERILVITRKENNCNLNGDFISNSEINSIKDILANTINNPWSVTKFTIGATDIANDYQGHKFVFKIQNGIIVSNIYAPNNTQVNNFDATSPWYLQSGDDGKIRVLMSYTEENGETVYKPFGQINRYRIVTGADSSRIELRTCTVGNNEPVTLVLEK